MRIGPLCFALILSSLFAPVTFAEAWDDAVKAYEATKSLAEQGDVVSQYNLGVMYAQGLGVAQDNQKAMTWFRQAAEQGDSFAQFNLGAMYVNGQGVPKDVVMAYALINLSAAQGNENAISAQPELEKMLTDSEIEEGQKLSQGWKPGMPLPGQ